MAKDQAPRGPRAETPKGFRDYFGAEVAERTAMLDAIAKVYKLYGFDALETPAVETVEALGKFLPDVDRPNQGVFAWQEDAESPGQSADWLALRYDLTAPLARVAAQYREGSPSSNWPEMPKGYEKGVPMPYRRYAMGPVWRNEKPGPGRFRQFYQCDADTVGSASLAADAEICMMLADALEAVGIPRGDYVVRVNNRKVLEGILDSIGITPDDDRRPSIFRTMDKFDKVGEEGVLELLTTGRRDASGAYIDGVGLGIQHAQQIAQYLGQKSVPTTGTELSALPEINARRLASMRQAVGGSEIGKKGVDELEEIAKIVFSQGYGPDRIVIDSSVVRGLGYYTGPVFEAELTFEILDDMGWARQFGSVAGGGRYDDLVKRFTDESVPATGVSIGVDRLLAALRAKGRTSGEGVGPVVVTVMDRGRMADYFAMAGELRRVGIRAEVYLGNHMNLTKQLKYADKRNSPVAVIQGGDEAARGVVQLKDLHLGARIATAASHEEWKAQPAQTEVLRADLVAEVQRLLGQG